MPSLSTGTSMQALPRYSGIPTSLKIKDLARKIGSSGVVESHYVPFLRVPLGAPQTDHRRGLGAANSRRACSRSERNVCTIMGGVAFRIIALNFDRNVIRLGSNCFISPVATH